MIFNLVYRYVFPAEHVASIHPVTSCVFHKVLLEFPPFFLFQNYLVANRHPLHVDFEEHETTVFSREYPVFTIVNFIISVTIIIVIISNIVSKLMSSRSGSYFSHTLFVTLRVFNSKKIQSVSITLWVFSIIKQVVSVITWIVRNP
jgi:hypothetical protein